MSVNIEVPKIGESVATVFVAQWLCKPGDAVRAGDPVVEVDSDKASMEIPAPVDGILMEALAEEGEEVAVGVVIGRIDDTVTVASEKPAAKEGGAKETAADSPSEVRAGPAARQLASQEGVDLNGVEGSGKHGRVLSDDVRKAASQSVEVQAPAESTPAPQVQRIERVPMTPMRRTIARRLVQAQQTAAMLTTFNEVDLTEVMALRKRYQEKFVAKYGIKLGFMSFFVKAAIDALKAHPAVNAEIDGNDILYKRFYNVGVAVSTKRGLTVPVVKDADLLSFAETEQAIAKLAVKARDGKLVPADFRDGTFTISNGGVFGSLSSTPILNPPQVGILGMHSIQTRPVGRNGEIVLRPMMNLALSYDHRIIDGREAVGFLVRIKELVESPERMLIEI
jgi:2-oxoglutarate dehydrogenase E2 component (dihydrolipoamide succinyltransferase)